VRKEKFSERSTGESLSGLQRSVTPTDTKPLAGRFYTRESRLALPQVGPLLTGMGAGMATSNALVISFGLYYLLNPTPSHPGLDVLLKAAKEYQAGNLDEAISLAQSVPLDSSAYQESLIALQEWRQEWNLAADQFKAVEQAFNEGRWRDVLKEARKTPNIAVWQQKIEPFVEQAKPELELEAQQLLQRAYQRAALKDFTGALALIKEIPPETPTGIQIQPKLSEYSRKQQIKADSLLQQAYNRASQRDFIGALEYLSKIPEETPAYETAQIKMAEYSQKQDFKEEVERQVQLSTNFPKEEFKLTKLSQRSNSAKGSRNLNPGSHLKEATPKPVAVSPAKR
jgi:serine/threonine-protein kinase